jgi:flagellar biosynthesis/type III secretory pathway chaperone
MSEQVEKLIEALRYELRQYGEMLALLDRQQEDVLNSDTTGVLDGLSAISVQTNVLKNARIATAQAKFELCSHIDIDKDSTYKELISHLSTEYQILLNALIDENNWLVNRIDQRAKQNHLLLKRSIEMIQQLIGAIVPGLCSSVYNQNGNTAAVGYSQTSLYSEIG